MAEEHHHQDTTIPISSTTDEPKVESTDRGLFGFGKKEEEKQPQEEAIATDFAKVHVSEPHPKVEEHKEEEVKKHSLLEKLHRSDSSSSSSSEEEEGKEGEEKKKKKKEKKKKEEVAVPVEVAQAEEKKGFLEKIKDKLPGGQPKKTEEVTPPPTTHAVPAAPTVTATHTEEEHKEKKGILEKIKEKLPGYHSKPEEDKDEKKEIKD